MVTSPLQLDNRVVQEVVKVQLSQPRLTLQFPQKDAIKKRSTDTLQQ